MNFDLPLYGRIFLGRVEVMACALKFAMCVRFIEFISNILDAIVFATTRSITANNSVVSCNRVTE